MTKKLVVLVSGNGTNLQAILDAITDGSLNAEIVLVVSNRKAAYGLVRAECAGIPTLYFPLKPFLDDGRGRQAYDLTLAEQIIAYQPDIIVLAGWMHIFDAAFLDQFPERVINLHPALPGQFPGINAIERSFDACQRGEAENGGCMVHFVIPEVDAGKVIAQTVVPYYEGDTLDDFEARMHDTEHKLFVAALQALIRSK